MNTSDEMSHENISANKVYNNYSKVIDIFNVYIFVILAIVLLIVIPTDYEETTLFYLLVILGVTFFAWLAENSKNLLYYNVNLLASFSILFFVYGFRNYSSIDDSSYINIFNKVKVIGWKNQFLETTMEPGYLILNHIVGLFTNEYLYMQLLTAFIPLFLIYRGFTRYRHIVNIPTAVFLLCCMLYFQMLAAGLVRMFIAISIVFIAFDYIPKRKPLKYSLLVVLASLFHYSSIILLLLVYFAINKKNLSKKVFRIYSVAFIFAPFMFIFIANYVVPLLGSRYQNYAKINEMNIGLTTFTTLPFILLLLLFYKKFGGKQQLYFKLFLLLYSFSIIIFLFGGIVNLGRLIFYSYVAFILAIAMVSKLLNKNSLKLIFLSVVVFYGYLYLYWTQFSLDAHIPFLFPYQNLFFNI